MGYRSEHGTNFQALNKIFGKYYKIKPLVGILESRQIHPVNPEGKVVLSVMQKRTHV